MYTREKIHLRALCLTRSDVLHVRSSPRVAVRFVFTFIHRLALPPPTLPRGHPIGVNPDPSASLRYPEPPRFHGRPRELFRTARNHPHHCHQTKRRSKGKWMAGNRGNRRDTRFTTRPLFVARAFEPVCFPSNLNYMYIYICIRNLVLEGRRETTGLEKSTKTEWNLLMRPCDRKCFRSAGSGAKRCCDQSLRRDQQPRRHSLAPPEGRATRAIDILLPELPGCCDGPGVAITAPATPPPVPRRRHPSSYAPSTVSTPRESLDDGSNLA